MTHRAYTFHSITFQLGMSSEIACQKYEDWLVSRFKHADDIFIEGTLHCKHSIDFCGKPHMSYDFIGLDGCKNYISMCGESALVLHDCLLKFMELSGQQHIENIENIENTNIKK